MADVNVLLTFAGGLAAALVFGYLAHRLRLSPIVGYLVAGLVVGPFTPGYVADAVVAQQYAEMGVILLLFGTGLRFHLRELLAVWRVAVPGAVIQSSVSTLVLAVLLHLLLGWDWASGIILGLAISVASTVVMALVLAERRDLHTPVGCIAMGWTVVEDLLTVAMLLVLPILFAPGGHAAQSIGTALPLAALKVMGLVAVVLVLGRWVIPWALERVARTRSRELFTLAVLVLAVGIAVGSTVVFGVSMALGAFLAGLAVGRSEFAARAAGDAVPMRDAFAVLFFVSVGMMFDPASLVESPVVIGLVVAVVLLGKPLAALLTVRCLGVPWATALPIGAAFAQVGEFSFILGTVAQELNLLHDGGWDALVVASVLSIALNSSICRWAHRWARHGTPARPPLRPLEADEPPALDSRRCVLVGYGPVGKIVHELLLDQGALTTVIDLNLETVRRLHAAGREAVYGDVLRPGTLEAAGIARAGSLIVSADMEEAVAIVQQARLLNPDLRILVHCAHLHEAPALRHAGAAIVVTSEAEVGAALAEAVTTGEWTAPEAAAQMEVRAIRDS